MIRKTDKYMKRTTAEWAIGSGRSKGRSVEKFRRETWWFLWVIPIYIKETVTSKEF
jgi:hypothetical protein